jgi:hypothetical protein
MNTRALITALVAMAFSASCSADELTRARAAALIEKDSRFSSASVIQLESRGRVLERTKQDAAVVEGLFSEVGTKLVPTAKGARFWKPSPSLGTARAHRSGCELATPARRRVVEITGIADSLLGVGLKELSFKWKYDSLPSVVARYSGQSSQPHRGRAIFRRYDDGWRLEEISLEETGRTPFQWSHELSAEAARQHAAALASAATAAQSDLDAKSARGTPATYSIVCRRLGYTATTVFVVTDSYVVADTGSSHDQFGYWQDVNLNIPSGGSAECLMSQLTRSVPPGKGSTIVYFEGSDRGQIERLRSDIIARQSAWKSKNAGLLQASAPSPAGRIAVRKVCVAQSSSGHGGMAWDSDEPCEQAMSGCSGSGDTDCRITDKWTYFLNEEHSASVTCASGAARRFSGMGSQPLQQALEFAKQNRPCSIRKGD